MRQRAISEATRIAREAFRAKSTGRFQEQTHGLPDVALEGPDPVQERLNLLEKRALEAADAAEAARRTMNLARAEVASLKLFREGIDVGMVYIEGDDRKWYVSEAFTPEGSTLGMEDVADIEEAMKDAGVVYEPRYRIDGVDLGQKEQAEQTPVDKAAGRVEKALAASVQKDEPETMATDLLTDLRLWADKEDVDFDYILERSYGHYAEEKEESAALAPAPAAPRDIAAEKQQLSAYADGQPDTVAGRLEANRARIAIAAREIEGFIPEAASFVMSLDPKGGLRVARAWDQQGWTLGRHDREAITTELRKAGAIYTPEAMGLKTMRNWLPGQDGDERQSA